MAAVVVAVVGLLHAWRNTNVLTDDRLCGDLVSAEQVDAVLPGSGRLDAEGNGLDKDLTDTVCRVGKSSVLLGSGESELTVRVWAEQGDDLLEVEHLLDLAKTSFFSGAVTGGVDRRQAWALLPEKCWTEKQPLIVRVSTAGPITDRAAFTTDAARSVAAAAHCGDLPGKPGPLAPPVSDEARPVSEGRVCGLDGLSVRGQVPEGAKVLEAGQRAPAGLWSCSLFLDDDSSGIVRADGFMTYTVSRDPLFAAAVRKAPGTTQGKAPDGRAAEVVNTQKMILPCAQGDPLYLAMRPGMQYLEAREPADLPVTDDYFTPFVKAAAKTFGCAAPTA
ncbi:hypothetical protein K7395_12150 [Streptomyces filamentosus]|uniref:Secreted protein n=1 Tax=Streptomyces filamentosus TaxID=67294 RepID=A0ABY4VBD0_STRFL|nr:MULTISPECIES: hypothetical protein [Streptomyces]MYR81070.1 hypothetical protein [Streptomyces sp. SID5466]USC51561.1 hypothetical protein K7395_12150 [Streptomyces filamentosus]